MPPEVRETWRSKFSGSADRRGIPLGTIVVSVATIILLLDLNAALILGLWVLRTILVYVVIAFFITLLLTPATRFLRRRGLSHGGATLLVFLLGVLVLGGLVYLFAEPLVTAAINFGKQVPHLVSQTKKGRGPIGRLVYRLHLQKYLSEDSTKLTSQITKVLKPATALSVGAAAASTIVALVTIAILTFFSMLEAPRMWRGFLGLFQPSTAQRLHRVVDLSIRSVTGYMLGNDVHLGDRRHHYGRHARDLRRPVRVCCSASSWPWWTCSRSSAGCWPASPWSSSRPSTLSRPGSPC